MSWIFRKLNIRGHVYIYFVFVYIISYILNIFCSCVTECFAQNSYNRSFAETFF